MAGTVLAMAGHRTLANARQLGPLRRNQDRAVACQLEGICEALVFRRESQPSWAAPTVPPSGEGPRTAPWRDLPQAFHPQGPARCAHQRELALAELMMR